MYHNSRYHCQWHNPMHNSWNNNNYNPHHYNWNNNNWRHPLYRYIKLRDYGQRPFVVNIDQAAKQNNTYRTALWTGKHFQVTLMSINVRDDIGLEVHPTTDQFIRIEEGQGLVQMGDSKDKLDFQEMAYDDYAITKRTLYTNCVTMSDDCRTVPCSELIKLVCSSPLKGMARN